MKLKQNSVYGKFGMGLMQEKDDVLYYDTDSIISMSDEQINDNDQPFIKVKLTNLGVEIYKQFNGFWESNFDEDGYSTFSKEYFERVFEGLNINDITKHDLIHFNK